LQAKKYDRAIAILAKHSWWDKLILVVRDVPKDDKKNLSVCVQHFRKVRLYVCVCMVCVCVCVNVCVSECVYVCVSVHKRGRGNKTVNLFGVKIDELLLLIVLPQGASELGMHV
jgi:hypothetical protein